MPRTQSTNIHPLANILDTCTLLFSSCAIFTVYTTCIMSRHRTPLQVITTRARSKRTQAKQNLPCETDSVTYAPGLSTLFCLNQAFAQPSPSFLRCPRPPSHHPSSLTSVYLVLGLQKSTLINIIRFKSPGSILTSRTETSSLSRVVRYGGDPCSVPVQWVKKKV